MTIQAYFTNEAGAPADPTDVFVLTMDPNQERTNHTGGELDHPGLGTFTYTWTPLIAGEWSYRGEGTGALVAAGDNYLVVDPSPFY